MVYKRLIRLRKMQLVRKSRELGTKYRDIAFCEKGAMMSKEDLRTYHRRETTRESGYHTCEITTGAEAEVHYSEVLHIDQTKTSLRFRKDKIELVPIFGGKYSIVAFGGYIKSEVAANVKLSLSCCIDGEYVTEKCVDFFLPQDEWKGIGVHSEIPNGAADALDFASVEVDYCMQEGPSERQNGATLEFLSFEFGCIEKDEFYEETFEADFFKKTLMNVPLLYYFDTKQSITKYLQGSWGITRGNPTIFKSCNRCGRFLPVSIYKPENALGFSRHCVKNHPCTHTSFCASKILEAEEGSLAAIKSKRGLVKLDMYYGAEPRITYEYGFQLECRACKKFFVNAPLNPQRSPQQFKEDGLRRRALEVLVNHLLRHNLVHFEYEKRTKKEFSEHIRKKFNCKCFKCGKEVDAHFDLDHTMPLAYLYRLDESATCLCSNCNSSKRDKFPADFYTEDELQSLSEITGLPMELLHKREVNTIALSRLIDEVVWYFDEFLAKKDYQKERDGIKTADKINDSLTRILPSGVILVEEYKKVTGEYPKTVSDKFFKK